MSFRLVGKYPWFKFYGQAAGKVANHKHYIEERGPNLASTIMDTDKHQNTKLQWFT